MSTDFHPPVVIKPDISFSPDIEISEIHLANCSTDPTSIPQLQLDFLQSQLIGVQTDVAHILSTQALSKNITNFAFLEHISRAIQHLGTRSYIQDLTTYQTTTSRKPLPENRWDDIHSLKLRQAKTIYNATNLLYHPLQKDFGYGLAVVSNQRENSYQSWPYIWTSFWYLV